MARIAIVTSGHVSNNPRVRREADALADGGHEVTVIGVHYDAALAEADHGMAASRRWRLQPAACLHGEGAASWLRRLRWRARTRIASTLLRAGLDDPNALGYAPACLLSAARRLRADLTLLHLEPALWVARKLAAEGCRIGLDMEDWYSENDIGITDDAPRRAYLRRLEGAALRAAMHATTTSEAMAEALARTFAVPRPVAIYNADAPPPSVPAPQDPSLQFLWMSQVMGPGRGLDELRRALPHVRGEWELEIRAHAPEAMRAWFLEGLAPGLRARIRFEAPVPAEVLPAVVARHDVGLALDLPGCINKDLTAANKLLAYLQAGLRVVASDTVGQREVLARVPGAGRLCAAGDAGKLSEALEACIVERDGGRADRARIAGAADASFGPQVQAARLRASVDRALEQGRA